MTMTTGTTRRGVMILTAATVGAVALPNVAAARPATGMAGAASPGGHHGDDCAHAQQMLQMAWEIAATLRQLHGGRFEQAFMAEMIPHHRGAIMMARMELARGYHRELKRMAQNIIDSQAQEIATMTRWLRQWYGVTPQQAMANAPARLRVLMEAMEQQMQTGMAELASVPAGAPFDEAFMQHMISHHLAAVIEARTVPGRAVHRALVDLAYSIIHSQLREVAQMREWLRDWFHTEPCVRGH
jgi:uncharacterized protein (DUF305 family)